MRIISALVVTLLLTSINASAESKVVVCDGAVKAPAGQTRFSVEIGDRGATIELQSPDSPDDLIREHLFAEISSTPKEQIYWARKFLTELKLNRVFWVNGIPGDGGGSFHHTRAGLNEVCLPKPDLVNVDCANVTNCHLR